MKTQLSKPSRTKATYTEEYKQEALESWRKSGAPSATNVSARTKKIDSKMVRMR